MRAKTWPWPVREWYNPTHLVCLDPVRHAREDILHHCRSRMGGCLVCQARLCRVHELFELDLAIPIGVDHGLGEEGGAGGQEAAVHREGGKGRRGGKGDPGLSPSTTLEYE